ncbi:MAG: hypothetical protein GY826_12470, partial [Fuerstiella sp.]|nr:hypothetical protein [Fuerstiella sp.]
TGPFINGLAMTNSISAHVAGPRGTLLFDGQRRGICGDATRHASLGQTELFRKAVDESEFSLDLIGVGGISEAAHVRDYLAAGATSVAMATSLMVNPDVGREIRSAMTAEAE